MARTIGAWFAATVLMSTLVSAAPGKRGSAPIAGVKKSVKTYKTVGEADLKIHIYEPETRAGEEPLPAIVFFFGGGWVNGSPGQFFHHCEYLASRGMVAMSAEYRVRSKHGTTPFDCVSDGKSAIRWVREHASELGVDPGRIAAGGGSAGGHVAACTGTIDGHEQDGENTDVSSKPNAMVLFNPVIDTTEKGYGANRLRGRTTEISPCHHVKQGVPPTIIFHGTADKTVPFENVQRFETVMKEAGNRCELVAFEGKGHGFFNYNRDPDNASFNRTMSATDRFLTDLGWLAPK
jgi:acetyl esterase/lipase